MSISNLPSSQPIAVVAPQYHANPSTQAIPAPFLTWVSSLFILTFLLAGGAQIGIRLYRRYRNHQDFVLTQNRATLERLWSYEMPQPQTPPLQNPPR